MDAIEAFGKAAIVGTAGEIEHGGALIHTPLFGNLMRDFLEGESIILLRRRTGRRRGDAGGAHVAQDAAAATRSHYQTITARVSDAPRAGELVVIAAASTGRARIARIGDRDDRPDRQRRQRGGCSVMVVRKIVTVVEEIHVEGGREVTPAARVAVVAAMVDNPWAGQGFVDDLGPGIDDNASDLGELLAPRVLDALGAPAEAYGKAAIVGLDGEVRARLCH